ncbi:hypothetical protein K435DRAFT_859144 [Dendrothele bispora CBS 962.96]|uniref:Uncharacterized protein n=1 Tax=Dendrothele bispora (strain CBS 962.96) TaxID=1314807 RepID=A0A4S8M145_DENBC|nr:hypothetical protein K435DRAFT_859144 [Dendrothele bispora CBS 962.96]
MSTYGVVGQLLYPTSLTYEREAQSNLVEDPEVLAIIPFGAGRKFYTENPEFIPQLLEFLRTFRYDGLDRLEVIRPSPRSNNGGVYGAPWPVFLVNAPEEMQHELLYYGWFVVSPDLTFGVTKTDVGAFSWHIGNFQSNSPGAIRGDAETIARAMGDFKCVLYKDKEVLDTANRCLLGGKDGKTVNPNVAWERLVEALNSFTFTAVETRDPPTPTSMVLQLWGRPLTHITALHHDWIELIQKKSFLTRYHHITPRRADLNCVNCKSLTHPQHGCPLPKTVGWFGPTPKTNEDEDHQNPINPGGRGSWGSRGSRGYNRAQSGSAGYGRGYGRGDPNGFRGRARYPRY